MSLDPSVNSPCTLQYLACMSIINNEKLNVATIDYDCLKKIYDVISTLLPQVANFVGASRSSSSTCVLVSDKPLDDMVDDFVKEKMIKLDKLKLPKEIYYQLDYGRQVTMPTPTDLSSLEKNLLLLDVFIGTLRTMRNEINDSLNEKDKYKYYCDEEEVDFKFPKENNFKDN